MSKGWIKLHRQIMEHPFYEEERVFSRHEAWEYLLLNANHSETKVMIDGKMVTVERGSFISSIRKFQERWKWSNTKAIQFLDLLEREGMIVRKSDTKKTVVTIVKYDFYQGEDEEKTTQKRRQNDTETIQKHTNKNEKNDKEKTHYADNVTLTEKEYSKLCDENGKEFTDRCIEYLSLYKLEKSYKTKSDNLTIRRWVVEAVKKPNKVVSFGRTAIPTPEVHVTDEERERLAIARKSQIEHNKSSFAINH